MEKLTVMVKYPNQNMVKTEIEKDVDVFKSIIGKSAYPEANVDIEKIQFDSTPFPNNILMWSIPLTMYSKQFPLNFNLEGNKFYGAIIFTSFDLVERDIDSLSSEQVNFLMEFDHDLILKEMEMQRAISPMLELARNITLDTLAERHTTKETVQVVVKSPSLPPFKMELPKAKFKTAIRKWFNKDIYDFSNNHTWVTQKVVHQSKNNEKLLCYYNEEAYQQTDSVLQIKTSTDEVIDFHGAVIIAKATNEVETLTNFEADQLCENLTIMSAESIVLI